MKKIADERLTLLNLQHIRITYIVQTLGILFILFYDFIQGGLEKMSANPLWIVFILSTVIYSYLSLSITIEHEKERKSPFRSFLISLLVLLIIVITTGYLTFLTPGFGWKDGMLFGTIIFICGLIPINYAYRLRAKQQNENND